MKEVRIYRKQLVWMISIILLNGIYSGCTSQHYIYRDAQPADKVTIYKRQHHPHKIFWPHRGTGSTGTSW